jgi:excisionase family DNA binding protein
MIGDLQWISTASAAELIGITTRTLYRFINDGELPAYKFGRVIRLKEADVMAYIERCRLQPGSIGHLCTTDDDDRPSDMGSVTGGSGTG